MWDDLTHALDHSDEWTDFITETTGGTGGDTNRDT